MTGAAVGVLALQGDVGNHERLLRTCGSTSSRVRLPRDLDGIDALIIPGGESTAIWRLAEDFDMLRPVRGLIADGMPVFGACAGMIMLADRVRDGRPDQLTFGGLDITVRRNAFGRQVNSFEENVAIPAVGGGDFPGVFIRAPWVEECGTDVQRLGTVLDATGREHVVAVRQGNLLATAFHPELTDDPRIHAFFVDQIVNATS